MRLCPPLFLLMGSGLVIFVAPSLRHTKRETEDAIGSAFPAMANHPFEAKALVLAESRHSRS